MSRNKLVSTIIATHNRPEFVVRTLDCLARQTCPPAEVIVVDDGSQPAADQAIREWQRTRKPPFKLMYHWQANAGPAVARNRGVTLSTGDLIHFIDDDDLMHHEALASLVAAVDTDSPAIAMASYQNQWDDGTLDGLTAPPGLPHDERVAAMIAGTWFVPLHGYLLTRAAVEAIGGWNAILPSQEDDEYFLRAAMASVEFVRAPQALVYYCQHLGKRRATPGQPGESVRHGLQKRLFADLAIREGIYERLRATGQLMQYRPAFHRWEERLRQRYAEVLHAAKLQRPILEWLAAAREGVEITLPFSQWSTGGATARRRPQATARTATHSRLKAGVPLAERNRRAGPLQRTRTSSATTRRLGPDLRLPPK